MDRVYKKEHPFNEHKVIIRKNGEDRYFSPHVKEISVDDQTFYLIVFDEVTKQYNKMKKLQNEIARDTLTKLFNRRKFNEVLEQQILLSKTTSSALSILFIDMDHFKIVNDTLGHNVGDEVLIELVEIISSVVREGDFAARWGGEEFTVTLQSTDKYQASVLAEKLRKKVENHTFENAGKLTISLGVTEYIVGEEKESFMKRVDNALYEAKHRGRNRVVVH